MTLGPIEFTGEERSRAALLAEVDGHTEFGGAAGLVQPELAPDGGEGHSLDASEARSMMTRVEDVGGGVLVDPVTGREFDPSESVDVTGNGGKFSDMQT